VLYWFNGKKNTSLTLNSEELLFGIADECKMEGGIPRGKT